MKSAVQAAPAAVIVPAPTADTPKIKVTDEVVQAFADAILDGKPTAKILPSRIKDLDLTDAQKDTIRQARRDHDESCRENKAQLMSIYRSKRWGLVAHRTNAHDDIVSLRLKDDKAIAARRKSRKVKVTTGR